jgi:sulfotransferase family protein
MATHTVPYFLVGSGRSGTRTIFKLLSGVPGLEVHHEFVCTHIQQIAALYYMGLMPRAELLAKLRDLHGGAIFYTSADRWMDCSNKLSWIIEPLLEMFPNARFIHLARDGRKVANSYFHKLSDEMYDDESVAIVQRWLADRSLPMPPPEKKYWWNIPQPGQPWHAEFPRFNQFQRACYQWAEANRAIVEQLARVPAGQRHFVRLEELVSDRGVLRGLLDFIGIPFEEHFFEFLQTPQNVIFPMDFKLTGEQQVEFDRIGGGMMERLGYANTEEYEVNYGTM